MEPASINNIHLVQQLCLASLLAPAFVCQIIVCAVHRCLGDLVVLLQHRPECSRTEGMLKLITDNAGSGSWKQHLLCV